MSLQNRVTPLGDIVAAPQRGALMGNRGIIHDPATRTLRKRRWSTKAWIICVCEFRGRRREVMAQRSWTELFFLDEATALAAGHRPCFYCRREAANAFRAAWATGNRTSPPRAWEMDAALDAERRDGRDKRLHDLPAPLDCLPDGAMVRADGESFLMIGGRALRWSLDSYRESCGRPGAPKLITPPSTLRALLAGYRPQLHPSAERAAGR